jgi:hypothetical protein
VVTDVGVGDIEVPFLDVTPGDVATLGSLLVTAPDGEETEPEVTTGTPADGTVRLTAEAVTYDRPGRWVLHWVVTGTGASAEDQEVYVVTSPVAGGPLWTPGRSRVANYVPGRTLSVSAADTHELTFTSTTRPTGVMVDRLIADAVAWVTTRTGEVHASLADSASVCAAIWAAAAVERGFPEEDQPEVSLRRAADLQALAERMLADLVAANNAVGGPNPNDPGAALKPVYSFPQAVAWGDQLFL